MSAFVSNVKRTDNNFSGRLFLPFAMANTAYFVRSPTASVMHPIENKSFKKDFYKSTSIVATIVFSYEK